MPRLPDQEPLDFFELPRGFDQIAGIDPRSNYYKWLHDRLNQVGLADTGLLYSSPNGFEYEAVSQYLFPQSDIDRPHAINLFDLKTRPRWIQSVNTNISQNRELVIQDQEIGIVIPVRTAIDIKKLINNIARLAIAQVDIEKSKYKIIVVENHTNDQISDPYLEDAIHTLKNTVDAYNKKGYSSASIDLISVLVDDSVKVSGSRKIGADEFVRQQAIRREKNKLKGIYPDQFDRSIILFADADEISDPRLVAKTYSRFNEDSYVQVTTGELRPPCQLFSRNQLIVWDDWIQEKMLSVLASDTFANPQSKDFRFGVNRVKTFGNGGTACSTGIYAHIGGLDPFSGWTLQLGELTSVVCGSIRGEKLIPDISAIQQIKAVSSIPWDRECIAIRENTPSAGTFYGFGAPAAHIKDMTRQRILTEFRDFAEFDSGLPSNFRKYEQRLEAYLSYLYNVLPTTSYRIVCKEILSSIGLIRASDGSDDAGHCKIREDWNSKSVQMQFTESGRLYFQKLIADRQTEMTLYLLRSNPGIDELIDELALRDPGRDEIPSMNRYLKHVIGSGL
jgi:hypothetical protein